MKSVIENSFWFVLVIGFAAGLVSCSDMDEYKKYVDEGEVSYTGKIDSLTVYSGHNRVMVEGLFTADPKINETRIFWNNGQDSSVVPVNRTAGVDTMQHIIDGLQEKVYNFQIITYDSLGNSSLPVNTNARVYGERYQNSLNNRPVVSSQLFAGNLETTIKYGAMDLTSGVFATEMRYTDENEQEHTETISIENEEIVLPSVKIGSTIEYRTMFLPEATSIDTFYTDYTELSPELVYLKNKGNPFERSSWDGSRWGILAEWITNDDVKNAGGYGGYELRGGTGVLSLEGGWGLPAVPNGKIYQVVTLPPGDYTFSATGVQTGAAGTKYLTATAGDEPPHVDNVPAEAMAYIEMSDSDGTSTIEFTLTENTQMALGFVGYMPDSGSWFKVHGVTFTRAE